MRMRHFMEYDKAEAERHIECIRKTLRDKICDDNIPTDLLINDIKGLVELYDGYVQKAELIGKYLDIPQKGTIAEAFAVYTGGGIWLFHGRLTDGNWFLTDDYGCTVILDADPSDFDESLYEDWQKEHLIEELEDDKRITFGDALIEHLRKADSSYRGGISDQELDYYERYFKTI